MSVVVPQHTLLIHLFFFFPGPPNFGMSNKIYRTHNPDILNIHKTAFFAFDLKWFDFIIHSYYSLFYIPARLSVGSFCDSVGIKL